MNHIDDLPALGRRLKQLRAARGLSQRDLAFEGCSYAYVSRIESGDRQPTRQVLEELAAKLGTTAHYLITGEPDPVELGLADAHLTRIDLTDDERALLDQDVEQAIFKAARSVAWAIRRERAEAQRALADAQVAAIAARRVDLEGATA